ncbi:MAG: flagellar hook capping FlgD N-terminal domain-containing protein [Myxococcota bacterium]
MDPVSNSSTSPVGLLTGPEGGQLGKDEFLTLLIEQISNQDPLEPMEDTEFIAQLAQFSALEQQMVTNDLLENLEIGQVATVNTQVTSLIGSQVTVLAQDFEVASSGVVPELEIQLPFSAEAVTVNVVNSDGTTVKQIEMGSTAAGRNALPWNGLDDEGQPLPAGTYSVDVFATDTNGEELSGNLLVNAPVTGVTYESGAAQLLIGSVRVSPSAVVDVKRD